jgi:hypothetical protein
MMVMARFAKEEGPFDFFTKSFPEASRWATMSGTNLKWNLSSTRAE